MIRGAMVKGSTSFSRSERWCAVLGERLLGEASHKAVDGLNPRNVPARMGETQ